MAKPSLTTMQVIVLISLTLLAVAGLSWFTYDIGRSHGVQEVLEADIIKSGFEKQASSFQKTSHTIYQEIVTLKRQLKLDQVTQEELKKQIFELQSELVNLREELVFYQQIVAPEKLSGQINLQSLKIIPTSQAGQYSYQIVLVQTQRRRDNVSGTLELILEAQKGNLQRVFKFAEIQTDSSAVPQRFSFKYFQTIEGLLTVPDNFEPLTLRVKATLRGSQRKDGAEIDEEFDWVDLI